jgi:hypothetical protein
VPARSLDRLEVEHAFQRPAGLAEQVTDGRGQRHRRGADVPPEPIALDRANHATEPIRTFAQSDAMPEFRQSRRGGHAAETSTDHHDRAHGRGSLLVPRDLPRLGCGDGATGGSRGGPCG